MMSATHAAIAISATSIAISTANPFVLVMAAIGSQLPDLDTTESFTGRIFYPIAHWLEDRYPHRTITHSFVATAGLAVISAPLLLVLSWKYWAALVLGHFCGWFSDCFTKAGVAAFFPSPARLVIPGNPKARLESKSPAEYWVLAIAVLLAVVSTNLISAGGISEQFGRAFFQDAATAAQTFNKYGSQQVVTIAVEGINIRTSQQVQGSFTVIEASDRDVIAETATGVLYKIGSAPDVQIQPRSVKVQLGDRVSISAQEVTLQEIAINDWLSRLPQNAYLSGSLLLDDMEDVQIPLEIERYSSLRMFGGQVELSNARPAQVATLLGEFWVLTGKVVVKVRQ